MQVKQVVAELKERWQGKEYDILTRNCNHFCQEFAQRLGVSNIPGRPSFCLQDASKIRHC